MVYWPWPGNPDVGSQQASSTTTYTATYWPTWPAWPMPMPYWLPFYPAWFWPWWAYLAWLRMAYLAYAWPYMMGFTPYYWPYWWW